MGYTDRQWLNYLVKIEMESKAIKCIDFYNPTFTQFQTRSFIDCVYVRVCVCLHLFEASTAEWENI